DLREIELVDAMLEIEDAVEETLRLETDDAGIECVRTLLDRRIDERIGAFTSVRVIPAKAAVQGIVVLSTAQRVVSCAAVQGILTVKAGQRVVLGVAGDRVAVLGPEDPLDADELVPLGVPAVVHIRLQIDRNALRR